MGVVYAIFDPRSSRLVYIGKAKSSFERRRQNHLSRLTRGKHENPRLSALFNYLRNNRLGELVFRVVNNYDDESAAERRLIAAARARGIDLFNVSSGGEGGAGPRSGETRAKISAGLKGLRRPPRTDEHKRNLGNARRGKGFSDKQRARHSEILPEVASRGERHYRAKLTSSDVVVIRQRLASGETQHAIAGDYGVSRSTVLQIKTNRTWKHVKSEGL
jgi:hypothetical protein